MDLLTQTLNSFSTQISDGGVSFNSDIFEANLINLLILGGGLFYLLSGALSESLEERQQKILGAIQESEEKLQEAKATAQNVKSAILTDGKAEIERLTSAAKAQIGTIEGRVRKQISDYVCALALKRITMQLEGKLTSSLQQQIIDRNISKLSD